VTEGALTAAAAPDGPTGVGLLGAEQPGLEVLGASAYGAGATRAVLRAAGHLQTIKPIPLQSAVPGGFTIHDFRIDRQLAPSGARRASRRRLPARVGSASRASVPPARCVGAAPPPRVAAASTSTPTRTSCAPPAAARPPGASSRATGAGGRWVERSIA
jgi:hypothetical protein